MKMPSSAPCIALLALLLAGCAAIRPAEMALPAGLAERTVGTTLDGLGGGTRGRYALAGNGGDFARSAARLALFDELAVFDRGGAGFTIEGADFKQPVSARCRFRQTTLAIRSVEFRPGKLAYECDFEGAPAQFSLQEALGAASALGRAERRGQVTLGATVLTLRSVHAVAGSPLPLRLPIGYLVEQDGRALGAVELNGTVPRLRLPADAPAETRQALLLAALALGLLWDPAGP